MSDFICYQAVYNNEILYIGEGAVGRELHCTSGVSSVYGLNALVHNNEEIEVSIIGRFKTKEEAVLCETENIIKYKPRYNLDMILSKKGLNFKILRKYIFNEVKSIYAKRLIQKDLNQLLSGILMKERERGSLRVSQRFSLFFEVSKINSKFIRLNDLALEILNTNGLTYQILEQKVKYAKENI